MKGFVTGTTLKIILMLLVLVIAIIFLPKAFQAASSVIIDIQSKLGMVTLSNIEKAIRCAYYRCADGGCLNTAVTEIKWEEDGKEIECQEFCRNLPRGMLTSCNENSTKHPVSINLEKEETIELSHLSSEGIECITDEEHTLFGQPVQLLINYVYVEPSLIKNYGEEETKKVPISSSQARDVKCYKSVTIKDHSSLLILVDKTSGVKTLYKITLKPG